MQGNASKVKWLPYGLVFGLVFSSCGFMLAQEETTAPAPPADTQAPSLQQQAPVTNVRAVRLSNVYGTVQVLKGNEVAFESAEPNMPIVEGMKLVAAVDGRAEVQFEDGSVARVTPNSSITFTKLDRNPDGSTVTVIQADSGLTYYELNGRAGQYTVQFDGDSVIPNDSSIFRVDLDRAPELAVTHGSVHAANDQGLSADVHTNQTAHFDAGNPNEYQLVESVTASSWDQWNSDRDEALAELDNSATEARAATGNPDNPAWSDLDAYGDWYDVPGYGEGWSPSGVGADWDPYGLGSWGYYGGIGYTWISGYSWGWWPYRCGAWSWFDGFGWMWFPGNCGWAGAGFGGGWYPYGVIWTIPPGYHCLHRPVRIHHPGQEPGRPDPLIAVNRGPQFAQEFKSVAAATPAPRVFQYEGKNIAPLERSIHPSQGGPLGEGFTSTIVQADPSAMIRRAYNGIQYRPSDGRTVYQPGNTYTPAFRSGAIGGGRYVTPAPRSSPVYRAPSPSPAPVFHAPASAPASSGGHPHG